MLQSEYQKACKLLAFLWATPLIGSYASIIPHVPFDASHQGRQIPPSCRYLPDDAEWPSLSQWASLNQTVAGRLIAGRPLAQVCYGMSPDTDACETLRSVWTEEQTYFPHPVEVMSPKFLNNSCTPFVDGLPAGHSSCTLGNLPSYAINASSVEDVQAGVKFATDSNIRLIVKNTGHDYLGRSSGKGSLSLWTHNLKSISFANYTSATYSGAAVRLGAGVMAYEAYAAVAARGMRITGGLCPTVGLAGGYVSGGGHGPLMGLYGLAADNTLEFEVVTTDGEYLVATPEQNADLFWALNGGGGAAYGIVLSQTTRIHHDGPVAAVDITFSNSNETEYWSGVDAWHAILPKLNGIFGFSCTFSVAQAATQILLRLPDGNSTYLMSAVAPFLAGLNVSHTYSLSDHPTFYDYFMASTTGLPYGDYDTSILIGGRLIPTSSVTSQGQRSQLAEAIREIVTSDASGSFAVAGNAADLSRSRTGLDNAVLPAWRSMVYSLGIGAVWDPAASLDLLEDLDSQIIAGQDKLRQLSPDSGIYINEATLDLAHWKHDFYGSNYERLLAVKDKYDPRGILYGPGTVGNDRWVERPDGRLCRE